MVTLIERDHGLELGLYAEEKLPTGAVTGGEITNQVAVMQALRSMVQNYKVHAANIALSESRGYLFEADVTGDAFPAWRTAIEQRLEEYVPLPPSEVSFDIAPMVSTKEGTHVVGMGYARRIIDESLTVLDAAGIDVCAIESETFALPRALLKPDDDSTVLLIDIGKTTTKLLVVSRRMPRFATTLDIGGHALTLAVQKHFGVTEEEAKRVKAERGLVAGPDGGEYLEAMISTVSVIREEILRRLDYWQSRAGQLTAHAPVTRAILVGGNATVRGLPEYLEASLKVPVELGDVFTNLAARDHWLPPIDYMESLAYGTAIGLALREYEN
jgi:type IV pilus assembly protein PilM